MKMCLRLMLEGEVEPRIALCFAMCALCRTELSEKFACHAFLGARDPVR